MSIDVESRDCLRGTGEPAEARKRKDPRVKRYLPAVRPKDPGDDRMVGYRTEAVLAHNLAVDAGADADVIAFLRAEAEWAAGVLWQHRPEVIRRLLGANKTEGE